MKKKNSTEKYCSSHPNCSSFYWTEQRTSADAESADPQSFTQFVHFVHKTTILSLLRISRSTTLVQTQSMMRISSVHPTSYIHLHSLLLNCFCFMHRYKHLQSAHSFCYFLNVKSQFVHIDHLLPSVSFSLNTKSHIKEYICLICPTNDMKSVKSCQCVLHGRDVNEKYES